MNDKCRIDESSTLQVTNWYQHVYDIPEMLILPLKDNQTSEMPVSGDFSLTGIERDCIYESC